ncbi:hypothetical protein QVD17_02578 [Tagetes erecta]|uniref:Uncharacterized protein n=1 Tax=Tagetes erecta TaxID=13708 RepID=A0AAD8LFX8_TARER|nr:hypothetical protein QVD17_02578 [Tagetes erecta]
MAPPLCFLVNNKSTISIEIKYQIQGYFPIAAWNLLETTQPLFLTDQIWAKLIAIFVFIWFHFVIKRANFKGSSCRSEFVFIGSSCMLKYVNS